MIWRYVVNHYPLTYDPQLWAMAFPLAMYTTGTFQLSKALEFAFLSVISQIMVYIAIFVWLFVYIGMLRHIVKDYRSYLINGDG
jgi:tellurite resistance protein TehA-like permease